MGLCAAASVCERKAPSDEWSIRMSKYNQFLHRPCIPWPCNHQGFTHKSTSRLSSSLFNELHSLEQFPDAKLNETGERRQNRLLSYDSDLFRDNRK